ncbi:MAG: pilus assembly protein [Azoarcus sp.]|jgi:type IV pilus assembly protein PilY1|nr:pilus assembly protein [Azoarcus sp.]
MRITLPRAAVRLACCAILLVLAAPAAAEIVIPPVPLNAGQSNPPLIMLVAGKDHKLFYEAYNDTSDLDGDGNYDTRFNPRIEYYGLFDSKLCYKGWGLNSNGSVSRSTGSYTVNKDYFSPEAAVKDMTYKTCPGSWSGNFLNYVTTSRMDALRKVLYGGQRSFDMMSATLLRRAYIPRDAHGWGKEYTSEAVDGYKISDYTPFAMPESGKRHFFGNFSVPKLCIPPSSCRDTAAPLLAVARNSTKRIWDWAAAEGDKLFSSLSADSGSSLHSNYVVQVEACSNTFTATLPDGTQNYRGDNCKPYTSTSGGSSKTYFKPVGMLHKFGEDGSMLFGLLTGSYNKNMSGGVLRKAMSSFANEINPENGQFTNNATIVQTFDRLMIFAFRRSTANNYVSMGIDGAWVGGRIMNDGEFPDWGNPVGEMMYEAIRYLGGAGGATPAYDFTHSGSYDSEIGLPRAAWDKPYDKVPWCSKPNILVLSDINPSFDSDQLPGARFKSCMNAFSVKKGSLTVNHACNQPGNSTFSGAFGSLNVSELADTIGQRESINGRDYFIGQSGSKVDWSPTAKRVDTLSTIRGLAPEETGKEGSYYSAAVAYYGKSTGIQTAAGKDRQKIDTYVVALASPLPKIEVPTSSGIVTIVPFGKSVKGADQNINAGKEYFQPANQIVEFYIKSLDLHDPGNGGRYRAVFQISYEDMEQGADHDMDVIAEYEIKYTQSGTVEVKVTPTYQAAGIILNIGYTISGTTKDGPYLVAQSKNPSPPFYYLNVPADKSAGYCQTASASDNTCKTLPACSNSDSSAKFGPCTLGQSVTHTFTPSARTDAASLLKDPLWYAAKWGGFRDKTNDANHWPNVSGKWDSNGDQMPDNYFLVRNALGLQAALEKTLGAIKEGASSSGGIEASSVSFGVTETLAFTTQYQPSDWSGDLIATTIVPVSKDNPDGIGPVKWRAAENMPAASSRRIFTRNNANSADIASVGREFTWDNLNTAQQSALTEDKALDGQSVVEYVRGSNSKEVMRGGTFRDRSRVSGASSPLGDSPHNEPRYAKASDTLYLGANDGMLHGFDARNGRELFAYIPSALIPKLSKLTHVDYGHEYYVDGEAETAAVDGRLYLIGAPGRGGKGLYGLDVTNPSGFAASDVKWELNGAADATKCGGDANMDNIGFVLSKPVIATLNDGKAHIIVGNGYNSCYGRAALYILDIASGAVQKRIDVPILSGSVNNGLSAPAVLDANGDGKVDIVYAGDMNGGLWRFDLSSANASGWGIHSGSVADVPIFLAANNGKSQPISAAPVIAVDNSITPARIHILFGTGRYLVTADKSDQSIQSWYGIIDDGKGTATRNDLKARRFIFRNDSARAIEDARTNDMGNARGWYIDFNVQGDSGERVISSGIVLSAQRGTTILFPSIIPVENDPCMAGGRSYLNFVNAFTGASLDFVFLDINGDGVVNGDDKISDGKNPASLKVDNGIINNIKVISGPGNNLQVIYGKSSGVPSSDGVNPGDSPHKGRLSWRELYGK